MTELEQFIKDNGLKRRLPSLDSYLNREEGDYFIHTLRIQGKEITRIDYTPKGKTVMDSYRLFGI